MRISVFPKGELEALVAKTMSLFDWIDIASTLPIEGLELYSRFFDDEEASFAGQVGEALHAGGLTMPMMCCSPDFTNPDRGQRERALDDHVRHMQITRELGGPGATVRVLSGQRHPGVSDEQGLDWAAESINALLPLARELDLVLALENHYKDGFWKYPEFAQKPELFHELLKRVDDRVNFGVQFDPSNAITAGVDSADFLESVIDRVVTMQASDRRLARGATLDSLRFSDGTIGYSPDLQHGVIGEGLNDYPRIFAILTAAGYDGWISVEDGVNGMDEMRASVEFLKSARDMYFAGSMDVRVETHERARLVAKAGR
jgi:sugar phosphate isomerase/epimerase